MFRIFNLQGVGQCWSGNDRCGMCLSTEGCDVPWQCDNEADDADVRRRLALVGLFGVFPGGLYPQMCRLL